MDIGPNKAYTLLIII